jgi:outer membrane protein with beta-barrel domain
MGSAVRISIVFMLCATRSFAQEHRAFVMGSGGFAAGPDGTAGNVFGEVGVRIAPNLFVVGDFGQFRNVQPAALQPAIDQAVGSLAVDGLNVVGTPSEPAWYSLGGVRYQMPARGIVLPYVFGGVGFARLTPTAQFTYSNGTGVLATTPTEGQDVTGGIVSSGFFTQPAPENAFMFAIGGGVAIPVAPHLAVETGYRFSRIDSTSPINTQSLTFGLGYRF